MAEISVVMTGEEAKLWKAQQRILAQQKELEERYSKVGKSGRRAGDDATRGAKGWAAGLMNIRNQVVGVTAAYGVAQKAVQAYNEALANQQQAGQDAATAAIRLADAQAAVIKNLGAASDETKRRFITQVGEISQAAKLPSQAPALEAAASILSATGGSRERTLEILGLAAPLFREAPEQAPQFGGALGDIMKSARVDARQAAALILSSFAQMRFTELGGFGYVAPALAAGDVVTRGEPGLEAREHMALFAGVGGRLGHAEPAQTSTAIANLASNLAAVLPELDTSFERLRHIQEATGPEQERLIQEVTKSGFRGAIRPAIVELLQGTDTQTAQMVQQAFEAIQPDPQAVTDIERQLGELTPQLRAAGFQRRQEGAMEQFLTGSETLTNYGAIQEGLADALRKSQRGVLDFPGVKEAELTFEHLAGVLGPELAAETAIRRRIEQMQRGGGALRLFGGLVPFGEELGALGRAAGLTRPSPLDQERVQLLQNMVEEIRGLRGDVRQSRPTGDAGHRAAALAERSAHNE